MPSNGVNETQQSVVKKEMASDSGNVVSAPTDDAILHVLAAIQYLACS